MASTAKNVRGVMTTEPLTIEARSSVFDAARVMRGGDVGPIPVVGEDGRLQGLVTDRDIVVRGVAQGLDPKATSVGSICSGDIVTVSPDDSIGRAAEMMRDHSVRRLPVVEDGRAVGIVSIGDITIHEDKTSALADISSAPPNT